MTRAEHRAWRWERFALALVALWVATLGVMVWQFLEPGRCRRSCRSSCRMTRTVAASRRAARLAGHTPPEGVWMEMLSEWVNGFGGGAPIR